LKASHKGWKTNDLHSAGAESGKPRRDFKVSKASLLQGCEAKKGKPRCSGPIGAKKHNYFIASPGPEQISFCDKRRLLKKTSKYRPFLAILFRA
jgi:hypothetical protein